MPAARKAGHITHLMSHRCLAQSPTPTLHIWRTRLLNPNPLPSVPAGLRGKLGRLQSGFVSINAATPESGAQEARRHLDKLLAGEALNAALRFSWVVRVGGWLSPLAVGVQPQ
jgi:hypothetical protein